MTEPDPLMAELYESTSPSQIAPKADSDQLARDLADAARRVREGEAARERRAKLMRIARGAGWTQERIAEVAEVSQAAVSKILRQTPGEIAIEECNDPHYLLGRLLRIGDDADPGIYSPDTIASRLFDGTRRVTPSTLAQLRRHIDRSITTRRRSGNLKFADLQEALDDIDTRVGDRQLTHPANLDEEMRMQLGWHHQGATFSRLREARQTKEESRG